MIGPHAPTDPMAALVGRLSALDARLKALEVAASAPRSRLRLTATDDVSLSSTLHAFQVGPDDGPNLRIDANEIAALNNGAGADLFLNPADIGANVRVRSQVVPFVQYGQTEVTTTTNGLFTLTWPVAFPSTAYSSSVVVRNQGDASNQYTAHIQPNSKTAATCEYRMMVNAANVGTGFTRTVEWIAVGTHP